jgi:DHA2 family multidrug resistance protein-like MFS transporter
VDQLPHPAWNFGDSVKSEAAKSDGLAQPQRFWAVVTTAIAVFLTVVGASVANVALPTIAADLGVAPSDAVWIVNAYQVAILISLLPLAALGDIIGYRRVYLFGLVVFSAASLACALSPSLTALVLARIAQGVGAAGVMSVNQALVRFIHPSHRLGYGIGITAVVIAVSAAAGPAIASAILSVLTWPWLFALGAPIGAAAIAIGIVALPMTPRSSYKFDVVSAILSALAFGGFVALIDTLGREGSAFLIGAELALTAVSGYLLWRRQLSLSAPLLPVDLLRIPVFALSIGVCASSFAAQMLALVVLPFHLTAAGYSAVEIGLLMIPWPLATALAAPVAGSLSDRYPAGLLGFLGLTMFGAGLAALALLPERAGALAIALPMALAGAGFGLYQSPNNRTIQGSAPRARSGAASGMASMARLLGQTVGAALAAFLFSRLIGAAPVAALWLGAGFAVFGAIVSAVRLTDLPQPKGKGA